jgi:hypothetical protein
MPITQITLENFKGVADAVTVPLRPITLLFGANSAGKSTLLQALLYLRELLERQNADADVLPASGDSINLGGFRKFVHGHDLSRTVRIGVTVTVDDDGLPDYRTGDVDSDLAWNLEFHQASVGLVKSVGVVVSVNWDADKLQPWITSYEVFVNELKLGEIKAAPRMKSSLKLRDLEWIDALFREANPSLEMDEMPLGSYVIPTFGHPLQWDDMVYPRVRDITSKSHDGSSDEALEMCLMGDDLNLKASRYIVGAGELVLRELQRIRYIGPIREVPSRSFAAQRTPAESRWADGSAAWDWLHLKPEFLTESTAKEIRSLGLGYRIEPHRTFGVPADSRLGMLIERARLGDAEAFEDLASLPPGEVMQIEEHSRVRIVAEESGVEVAPCDIGVGVAQVLPVVIGSMVPGYSVLAVEQPELHLHPAVQCRLADVFVRACRSTEERLTLLETHSEHLMLRLMRRMRETAQGELPEQGLALTKDEVQVLFVESFEGRTVFREMPLNSRGEWVKSWPGGFFDEDLEELF